jgi:hypothetical protein
MDNYLIIKNPISSKYVKMLDDTDFEWVSEEEEATLFPSDLNIDEFISKNRLKLGGLYLVAQKADKKISQKNFSGSNKKISLIRAEILEMLYNRQFTKNQLLEIREFIVKTGEKNDYGR